MPVGASSTGEAAPDPETTTTIPEVLVDGEEIDNLRRLDRTPQPYQLQNSSIRPDQLRRNSSRKLSTQAIDRLTPYSHEFPPRSHPQHSGRHSPSKRSQSRSSPSDSGTEADDENYTLKALPPAPVRPRKGLRGLSKDNVNDWDSGLSPVVTPAETDENKQFSDTFFRASLRAKVEEEARLRAAEEARRIYRKKRRAEGARRTCEISFLGVLSLIVLNGHDVASHVVALRSELSTTILIWGSLYALYVLRVLIYNLRRQTEEGKSKRLYFHVPAAFDPATGAYPILLPILASLSLSPKLVSTVPANICLGLAALPARLFPRINRQLGFDSFHWVLTLLPFALREQHSASARIERELVTWLYPLQQTLVPPIHYLTTSSLLPTELQLLATTLVNLLLHAESPQSVILKQLFWVGGVGLFIFCPTVLRWNVSLARIPRWKLKRASKVIRARNTFIDALKEGLANGQNPLGLWGSGKDDSDSDPDESAAVPLRRGSIQDKSTQMSKLSKSISLDHPPDTTSVGIHSDGRAMKPSAGVNLSTLAFRRRAFSSTAIEISKNLPWPLSSSRGLLPGPRSRYSDSRYYLSLTSFQVAMRKLLYAGWTFFIIIIIILLPIRSLIGKHALNEWEPFGWALGYLFGGIPDFRITTSVYSLDSWIPLTEENDSHIPPTFLYFLNHLPYIGSLLSSPPNIRLLLTAYWVSILTLGLATVITLSAVIEVDTRRKIFHGTMVLILLPSIYVDPCFCALTLSLILAVFCLLDLLRAAQVPPLSRPLARFLQPYIDGRDLRGPVVVSHIFLLLGCAVPLWLSLSGTERDGEGPWRGWFVNQASVGMVAGVVCVGLGDAAASLIGRRFGRTKWPWVGGKSLEGSLAFAVAVTSGLLFGKWWLYAGGWEDVNPVASGDWGSVVVKAAMAACGASFMEAVLTGGNDNVIVPVVLWLLVRGLNL